MSIFEAIIIAIVEGITEFLPISSTGHMILASELLGLENTEFLKSFEIAIQLGAILAIALMYIKRFFKGWDIYTRLLIAFLPSAIVGFLTYSFIKEYLFSTMVVSVSLVLGGILLIVVDKKVQHTKSQYEDLEQLSYKHAFYIGLVQCISMIPGVSRAGATIVGGVFNGLNRKQATEFSFLLAIPTMFAATSYDLLKTPLVYNSQQLFLLLTGMVTAYISAWITVKLFLIVVNRFGFEYFGWYRIVVGIIFLILIRNGVV